MIQYDPKRWIHVVLRVRGSVLSRVAGRVALVAGLGVVAAALAERGAIDLAIPGSAHAMVGVALGLLLVFRTNASYDRYWEGRKALGGLVNTCRDLGRLAAAFLSLEAARRAGGYTIALYGTIRRGLRAERELGELGPHVSEPELAALATAGAPPLVVARWLTELCAAEAAAGRLGEERLRMLSDAVGRVIEHWGAAERIVKTPVPFAYAHHIKMFLTLFCVTSPLALLDAMGWLTPVAAAALTYGLYGIDEIGVEIEDPFGHDENDLPLDAIGETIDRNVLEVIGK